MIKTIWTGLMLIAVCVLIASAYHMITAVDPMYNDGNRRLQNETTSAEWLDRVEPYLEK